MNIISDVFKELFGMFLGDARLTFAIVLLVAIVGVLTEYRISPLLAEVLLPLGCLGILVETVRRGAKYAARR